jgi:hypothetical protein
LEYIVEQMVSGRYAVGKHRSKSMKREGITPPVKVTWTDLSKPDKHGYFNITVALDPKGNEEHAKFLSTLKGQCAAELTAADAKPPWWQKKDNKDEFFLRFSSKYEIKEWRNREDQEIEQPRILVREAIVRIKYKSQPSGNGKFLNLYLNGVQIISIPAKTEPEDAKPDWEDPDDVPF